MHDHAHIPYRRGEQDSPDRRHPSSLGNPALSRDDEKKLRRELVEKALHALETEVDGQTVFDK